MRVANLVILLLCIFLEGKAQNIQYDYDAAGRVTVITYPNAKAVNYNYDKDGNRVYRATTIDSTLLPHAGAISGLYSVCIGSTITLSDSPSGGTWSASNGNAIVFGTSGIVTGVAVGIDTISYTVTNSYGSSTVAKIVTVNASPSAGAITGGSDVCVATSIPLADTALGGTWTASNGLASVSGGTVTGISAGSDVISYSVTNSCGTASATKTITVNPLPSAGTIAGYTSVCIGSTITLSDAVAGGLWNAGNASAAVSGSGIVAGISAGSVVISYAVTNSCGTAYATYPIVVLSSDSCSATNVTSALGSGDLIIVYPNPSDGTFTVKIPSANERITISIQDISGQVVETRTSEPTSGLKEIFNFERIARGTYFIKVYSNDKTYEKKIVIW